MFFFAFRNEIQPACNFFHFDKYYLKYCKNHTHYTLKRESLVGTLEAPRGVRQMNGVPQSGADRFATAESRVRANWSNRFTVKTAQGSW